MAESYQRQSALAHLGLAGRATSDTGEAGTGPAVTLAEVPYPCLVNLRGKPNDVAFMAAAEAALGVAPPTEANRVVAGKGGLQVIWLSPEEWWVLGGPDTTQRMGAERMGAERIEAESELAARLRAALAGVHAAVTEVGEGRTRLRIAGPRARDTLAKGCPLDLHPSVFGDPGTCAQTVIGKAGVLLHLTDNEHVQGGPTFDIVVLRSFADYLWRWLEDAGREYGMTVTAQ